MGALGSDSFGCVHTRIRVIKAKGGDIQGWK